MENNEESDIVTFKDLGLDEYALQAVEKKGFEIPSPIQVLAIPRLLTGDTNLIAKARTGTGKTAAFGLPIIQNIHEKCENVQALILEPTRELAMQIKEEISLLGKYKKMGCFTHPIFSLSSVQPGNRYSHHSNRQV